MKAVMMKIFFFLLPFVLSLSACSEHTPEALIDGSEGKLIPFSEDGLDGWSYGPFLAGVDVIDGDPEFEAITVDKTGRVKSGFWKSSKGKWHFANGEDHWEYCRIVKGVSIITEDGGEPQRFEEGDSFILHPRFAGTWETVEDTVKEYIIVDP